MRRSQEMEAKRRVPLEKMDEMAVTEEE